MDPAQLQWGLMDLRRTVQQDSVLTERLSSQVTFKCFTFSNNVCTLYSS